MEKTIKVYRHQKSVKNETGEKVISEEGRRKSSREGWNDYNFRTDNPFLKGYHSSALRTLQALESYYGGAQCMDAGVGMLTFKGFYHYAALDEIVTPSSIKAMRKELGDDESCRIRLAKYGGDNSSEPEEIQDYYRNLQEKGRSIADLVIKEIEDGKGIEKDQANIVVCYGHEPIISVSFIELMKYGHDQDIKDAAEFFRENAGIEQYFFPEGEGYKVELVDGVAEIVTEAGRFELEL
jgi:hypothetical protein